MLSQDQWFYQDSNAPRGRVYWLSIAAIYDGNTPPVHQWGWKTRPRFYSDDAVRILPPVAKCPNDCNSPNLSVFPAGTPDNFTLPAEAASPSPSLITFLGANLLRNFDETVNNQRFGHTFTGLPPCIKAATLEIRLKATGDNPSTDSLTLELVSLVPPKAAWGISILNLPLNPGWPITGSWEVNDVNTFTLNLANLPPNGSSILDYMNKNGGKLDVWLQDDTAFDYMILRVWSCPLVTDWPPAVTSLWENGQPIEYPPGTSWDTAFVLTSNRNYTPRLGIWPQAETISSDATPVSQIDFNEDLIINFQDFAVMAGEWLDEGEIWPEYDMP
jgi:hypothetical protein